VTVAYIVTSLESVHFTKMFGCVEARFYFLLE